LLSALVVVLSGAVLFFWGHPLIAESGIVKLWHGVVVSSENSQHITDWYTFSHIIHGFLFFYALRFIFRKKPIGFLLLLAVVVESAWELFENTDFVINRYRDATIALDYYGDSVINSVSDILSMVFGFVLASKSRVWVIVLLILIMELGVGYMIHDNLTLNIIMLIHPFPAILEWQSAL